MTTYIKKDHFSPKFKTDLVSPDKEMPHASPLLSLLTSPRRDLRLLGESRTSFPLPSPT